MNTAKSVKIIAQFCQTRDPSGLKFLKPQEFRYFVDKAKYAFQNNIGNREIVHILLNYAKNRRGKVYIGSFQKGKVQPSIPNTLRINVTSGSVNKIDGYPATQASPMYLGPVNNAKIFENYWQYGKVFKELGHLDNGLTTQKWENFRKKGYAKNKGDRHPEGTKTNEIINTQIINGKPRNSYRYLRAITSKYNGKMYDYITGRKEIYVPVYAKLVSQTPFFIALKNKVDSGQSVLILDYDGPRPAMRANEVGRDAVMEMNVENLIKKINDPAYPFGHGYVIAALLADIEPVEYNF